MECCAVKGIRSTSARSLRTPVLLSRIPRLVIPRRFSHHNDSHRRAKTAVKAIDCRTKSTVSSTNLLLLLIEVRDPHTNGIFDDHDFAVSDYQPANENVDIFSSRPGHTNDSIHIERQNFR